MQKKNITPTVIETRAPGTEDNETRGLFTGSYWFNTDTNTEYLCTDATATDATWIEITSAGDEPTAPNLQAVTDQGAESTNTITVAGILADVNSDNGQHVVLDYRGVTLENGGTFSGDGSNLTNLPIPNLQAVTDEGAETTNNITIANGSPVLTLDGEGHTPFTFHVDGGALYIGGDQLMIYANEENGYVGIGKNNPTSELDVDGIVTADSFVGDGSQLTNLHTPTFDEVVSSDEDANTTTRSITTGGVLTNGAVVIFNANPLVLYDEGNAHELSLTGNDEKIVASHTVVAPSFEGEIAAANISGTIANSQTTASTTHASNTLVSRDSAGAVGGLRIKDITNSGSLFDFRNNSNSPIGNITYNSGSGLSSIQIDQYAGATGTAIFYGDGSNLSSLNASNLSSGTVSLDRLSGVLKGYVEFTTTFTVTAGQDKFMGAVGITSGATYSISAFIGENNSDVLFGGPWVGFTPNVSVRLKRTGGTNIGIGCLNNDSVSHDVTVSLIRWTV